LFAVAVAARKNLSGSCKFFRGIYVPELFRHLSRQPGFGSVEDSAKRMEGEVACLNFRKNGWGCRSGQESREADALRTSHEDGLEASGPGRFPEYA